MIYNRQQAERQGRRAEVLAAWWLRLHGWQILHHRLRNPAGEIDLIARRGQILAFIEVKTRRHHDDGVLAVTEKAKRRICRAALLYLQQKPHYQSLSCRFDVITIVAWQWPRHIVNAWEMV